MAEAYIYKEVGYEWKTCFTDSFEGFPSNFQKEQHMCWAAILGNRKKQYLIENLICLNRRFPLLYMDSASTWKGKKSPQWMVVFYLFLAYNIASKISHMWIFYIMLKDSFLKGFLINETA